MEAQYTFNLGALWTSENTRNHLLDRFLYLLKGTIWKTANFRRCIGFPFESKLQNICRANIVHEPRCIRPICLVYPIFPGITANYFCTDRGINCRHWTSIGINRHDIFLQTILQRSQLNVDTTLFMCTVYKLYDCLFRNFILSYW